MAAPAPNSVAALAVNSFGGDNNAPPSSCLDDPNFATICSFIQNFGEIIRIGRVPFDDLQQMLENTADVPPPLVQLHITLLRRVFKSVTHDKWERSLAKFGHTYCSQDAWEIERFGYKKAKIQTKLRLLKNLLEAQFDFNVKFKAEVNKLQAADLRLTPLGRDTEGQVYWYQVDEDANLRVYREDIDDETWEIVASNKDELEELISQLQRGEVKKPEPEEAIILPEEDSNSKDDIEPKEIILDTGKVEESEGDNSSDSEEIEEEKKETRTVEPLIIKHNFNLSKLQDSDGDKVQSDTDNVTYEISGESESKVSSGLKMIFGVKSKPKNDNSPEVSGIEVKSCSVEETKVSDKLVKNESPVELSSDAPAANPIGVVPKIEKEENTPEEKVENTPEEKVKSTPEEKVEIPKLTTTTTTPVQQPKVKPVEAKATKFSGLFSSELSTKVDQRELQAKASKNLQKSAKVNSIVARLNRNLPDQSAKSVADLLPKPSPNVSKQESVLQKDDSKIKPVIEKATSNISPTQDKTPLSSASKVEDIVLPSPTSLTENNDSKLKIHKEPERIVEPTEKEHDSGASSLIKQEFSTSQLSHPPQENLEAKLTRKTISSITSDPVAFGQLVTTQKSDLHADTKRKASEFQAQVHSHGVVQQSCSNLKDKNAYSSLTSQIVPMEVEEPLEHQPPVVEEILTKKEAWICGKDSPVDEKPVVKEQAWVCGDSETMKIDVQQPASNVQTVPIASNTLAGKSDPIIAPLDNESLNEADNIDSSSSAEALNTIDTKIEASTKEYEMSFDLKKSDKAIISEENAETLSASKTHESVSPSARSHSASSVETPDSITPLTTSKEIPTVSKLEETSPVSKSCETILPAKECDNIVPATPSEALPPLKTPERASVAKTLESNTQVITSEFVQASLAPESAVEIVSDDKNPAAVISKISEIAPPKEVTPESEPSQAAPESKPAEKTQSESESEPPIAASVKETSDVTTVEKSDSSEGIISDVPSLKVDEQFTDDVVAKERSNAEVINDNSKDISSISTDAKCKVDLLSFSHSITSIVDKTVKVSKTDQPNTQNENVTSFDANVLAKDVAQKSTVEPSKNNQTDDYSESYKKVTQPASCFRKTNENKKVQENAPAPKVNSSLVLYSESSESSNEGFIIDTTVVSTESCVKAQSPTNKEDAIEAVTKETGNGSVELKNGAEDVKSISGSSDVGVFSQVGSISLQSTGCVNPGTTQPTNVPELTNSLSESINGNPNEKKDITALPSTNTESLKDDKLCPEMGQTQAELGSTKRKAEEEVESSSKVPRLDVPTENQAAANVPAKAFNPIVGDTVEEEVMTITGEGSGALNEGGNSPLNVPFNPICGETIEEEVMLIIGTGSGRMNQGSNENSPVALSVPENTGSQNESIESDEEESRDMFPKSRGRGGRRGRGRRGRPGTGGGGRSSQTPSTPRNNNRGSRGSREVARLGISIDSVEVNGENERPVRASRRIAQIRLKEEEERRKLEEERLAQLKAAQMQKKAKQEEKERNKGSENATPGAKVKKGRKSQKDQLQFATDYIPSASDSDNDDEDEDEDGSDEFSGKFGKGGKRRKRRKNGKAKKGGNPWATSDEDEEEQVEEEEEYHYEEEEEEELVFKSDHEFSPESDLGEDADVGPSRHARTAKQDKGDLFEEGNCCKCRKGDHPEWILLCDKCDNGWHASCLRPQLWYIPEGEWFCPPCQHNMLIENLSKNLVEYESLLKKRENEILRKQRLAYVGISLDNVLPDKEPEVAEPDAEQEERIEKEKKRQRRRILSDEELSDDFINDHSDDNMSRSRSGSSGDDSDEPVYRLRARRTKKAFDFKEYDDMINSALRVDDDEEGEGGEIEKMDQDENDEDGDEKKLNGEPSEDHGGVGGGKNDAYLKHLEKQAQEEDETDEELLDEKERLRRKELKKHGQRKTRRRINDLDAYSEEEDSDDDFKASEAEDEDEELAEDGESEWSGDKMEEDSDDSIAKRARRKERQGRHGRLGRREKYSDKGLVRRSTRKRRSRISYDESDDDEEEEDPNDKWQSDESEEEEEEESESNSESDDATWGKKKKKGFAAAKPKIADFVLGAPSSSKGKGKGGVKRKKRKTDNDDTDRAWNSARGKKDRDEPIERRTRGRKINFKDILDSGESDDDGNVRPKRRPLSDSDDSRSPSSSRKLAEEIRAENARREKEYEEAKKAAEIAKAKSEETIATVAPVEVKSSNSSNMPESLAISKLAESSVIPMDIPPAIKSAPSPIPVQLTASHVASPSPNSIPSISSPLSNVSSPPVVTFTMSAPASSSPVHPLSISTPPIILPANLASISSSSAKESGIPPPVVLPKSPPPHMTFVPKSVAQNSSFAPIPASISRGPVPVNMLRGPIPSSLPSRLIPPNVSGPPIPSNLPIGPIPMNIPGGSIHSALSLASSPKSIPPPVPVPMIEKKPAKQPKGSRGSRGSKSEKSLPSPVPQVLPPDLELALSKPVKTPPLGSSSSKSSKKKDRDRDRESSVSIPNPSLLLSGAGGVLPELLGMGLQASLRPGQGITGSPPISSSGGSSSKKSKSSSSSSRATQQTTPPPVSQNLSPSIPIDIDRVPNPALFQGNPGMRPFHPMWAVRNPGPPPPGYNPSGSPASLGKPPPLNSSPFSGQQGPPSRPGFPSPPPLRIPNPNTSSLQNFQHFKRDGPLGGPLYRLPPGQPQPGVLANILPPGMMSPHAGGPERFFGAPSGYPHPYGLLPPHSQGPPQALFPYDYRPPEPPFKDEPAPPRTTASSLPTPVSNASSSPPPTTSASVPLPTKDEGSAARDSEFGGLVSYFSSQRSEEDMDT